MFQFLLKKVILFPKKYLFAYILNKFKLFSYSYNDKSADIQPSKKPKKDSQQEKAYYIKNFE